MSRWWGWAMIALLAPGALPAGAQASSEGHAAPGSPCPAAPRRCAEIDRWPGRIGALGPARSVAIHGRPIFDDPEPRVGNRVVGGLLGALVGFGVGWWIGQEAASDRPVNEQEWAGVDEGLVGSAIGAPAVGHFLDGARGSPWPSLSVSAALALTGYATESGWLLGLAPVYGIVLGAVLR